MSERKRLRSFLESGSSESVHKNSSDSMGSSRRSSRANKGVKTTTNDIMEMEVRRAIKKQAVTKLSCSNPGKKAKRVVAKTPAKAHTNTMKTRIATEKISESKAKAKQPPPPSQQQEEKQRQEYESSSKLAESAQESSDTKSHSSSPSSNISHQPLSPPTAMLGPGGRPKLGPGGRPLPPSDETEEEKLARVTVEKLQAVEKMVREHPDAEVLGLLDWTPSMENFKVEYKPTSNTIHGRYVILGPGGRPQFHSIDNAALWIFKKRNRELERLAAIKKRFKRVACPEWPAWIEPSTPNALKDQCLEMLAAIGNADEFGAFTEPIPSTEIGYAELIETPMDLTTMATHAKAGRYSSIEEFRRDLALMISNALSWHPEGTDQHEETLVVWSAAQEAFLATTTTTHSGSVTSSSPHNQPE